MSHNKILPPMGQATPDQLKEKLEEGLYYEHPLYAKWRSEWRRAELFDQGMQWLQRGPSGFDGPGAMSQWASIYYEPSDANYIPTPVFNEGHGSRSNESARIGRPAYRPKVLAKTDTPNYKIKQGAKKSTDLLRHRLREMEWDKAAQLMYYHIPVYGGAWLKSQWEQRWDSTTMVPKQGAVGCSSPGCDFKLASPEIQPGQAATGAPWAGGPAAPLGEGGTFQAQACPQCTEQVPDPADPTGMTPMEHSTYPPLQPFQATMEEAATGQDSLGQPLGEAQPLGDWKLSIPSPYDVQPKNLGFMMSPGEIDEWREVHIETLDWVALRYPDKAAEVKPERPDVLAKYSPILGAPDIYGSILDAKILRDAVRIQEWHKKPWMERQQTAEGKITFRLNEGRSVILAGNVILLDAPYLIPSPSDPSKKLPRVEMDYIPWELKDGGRYLQGMSLWSLLFDPQMNANEIRSQAQSVRQRMAVPIYVALKSHNLEMALRDGVPGRFAMIDVDPEAPNMVPQVLNNMTIADGVWQELEDTVSSLEKFAGNVEVEKGQVPPSVSAALAIQYLKTYAGEKREPRIARIKDSLRRVWKHGLELMKQFYIEPREVGYEDEQGEERWSTVLGLDIQGETNVSVESEADFDDKAKDQELVLTLVERGIIMNPTQPFDASKAREVARILEAPEGIFEVEDLQKDGAQREFCLFKDTQKVPQVDPSLDDHLAHYQQHGIDAMGDYFRDLEEKGGWDDALKVLSPQWDMLLNQLAITPDPRCLQDRIFQTWLQILQMAMQPQIDPMSGLPIGQPLMMPPADPQALLQVLYWRAHTEDHRLTEQLRQFQASLAPLLAAPASTNAGPAGTQATNEEPPQPPESEGDTSNGGQ